MKLTGKVIAVARGEWGPFKDESTDEAGVTTVTVRTIPWVDLAAADGSGSRRATCAEGVNPPDLFREFDAALELYEGSGKLKLRYHGPAAALREAKAS